MKDKESRFAGWHVVVTGAGTGIGRAIALRLAGEGAKLTLLARNPARLEEVAGEIRKLGGAETTAASLDITDRQAVDKRFAEAAAKLGPIRALVANSGVGGGNSPGTSDRFDEILATNLTGTYSSLRAAERHLAKGPEARHLVVIASILGRIGVAGYTGYCTSKAGLLGLVRAMAMELAPSNVQVNAVCPGWVETAMAHEGLEGMAKGMGTSVEKARQTAMADVPLGRMNEPEDVAGCVAWLLSRDARGVTGQGIDMNGGGFMH